MIIDRELDQKGKDDNIGTVTVTKECIEKKGAPIIGFRG